MNLISDATLRDGNHAIRHQLGREQIADYARAANAAGIDIVEVGHGNGLGGSSCLLGQTPIDDVLMLETARAALTTSWLGVHFIPGLGKATDIELAIEADVDVVRVATHCTEANVSRRFIEQTRRAGRVAYGVLMMSHMAPPEVLLAQARLMQDYGAQAVILMDSAGYSTPNLVREKVRLLVEALRVDVGFHAHNNLGLAVANSLVALEQGARIVDACVKGFGAGAGNTQLETLVAAMEREGHAANTSFERVTELARESEAFLSPKTPHIAAANIASGLYGLFSGYVPHIQKAALEFGVNEFELYRRLAERRLVAGQEDIITEEASRLARSSEAGGASGASGGAAAGEAVVATASGASGAAGAAGTGPARRRETAGELSA
ncbi:4-hydroxy-2-oxovalerate aldolase [Burkholderia gladioli]|uniref:4-hydroxy-2-oxovalerate aldolase n=1 Tax=Burkholderia gladioli TaxID=28095 RepID=UPI000CDB75AD|nr:4-hydroxy-2-oxovalerate aldolase [Burkholderia gladioli]POS03482.1 4-hydroxy-2-oxovalerate aldolase [Burkholderia gladioli]